MKRPSKKLIVSGTAIVGIVVLVASAFILKPVILEQWYAWKLESQWKEERWAAAGELQTLRQIRRCQRARIVAKRRYAFAAIDGEYSDLC